MIGQPLSAAGSLQFITALMAMGDNYLPPTINYEVEDPECDLDYVPNKGRYKIIDTALVSSFGMGGNNVSVLLKKNSNNVNPGFKIQNLDAGKNN